MRKLITATLLALTSLSAFAHNTWDAEGVGALSCRNFKELPLGQSQRLDDFIDGMVSVYNQKVYVATNRKKSTIYDNNIPNRTTVREILWRMCEAFPQNTPIDHLLLEIVDTQYYRVKER
jgi:hypothetical protein